VVRSPTLLREVGQNGETTMRGSTIRSSPIIWISFFFFSSSRQLTGRSWTATLLFLLDRTSFCSATPIFDLGQNLGCGPTVGSPWSSSTPPSLGRGPVAPPPPEFSRVARGGPKEVVTHVHSQLLALLKRNSFFNFFNLCSAKVTACPRKQPEGRG